MSDYIPHYEYDDEPTLMDAVIDRVRRWWKWFNANFLTVDLTTPYRPPTPRPTNRRQRRKEAWNNRHPWTAFWKGVPWYKWREYYGAACSDYAKWLKNDR